MIVILSIQHRLQNASMIILLTSGPKLAVEISSEPMEQETNNYSNVCPIIDSGSYSSSYINVENVKNPLS